jgi:predicted transcriptional regulator
LKIINDILSVARHGERKTHIMYKANLSYDQLNEYLTFLLENQLVEKEPDQEYEGALVYKASQKGRQFLERYAQLQEIISRPSASNNTGTDYLDLTIIGE